MRNVQRVRKYFFFSFAIIPSESLWRVRVNFRFSPQHVVRADPKNMHTIDMSHTDIELNYQFSVVCTWQNRKAQRHSTEEIHSDNSEKSQRIPFKEHVSHSRVRQQLKTRMGAGNKLNSEKMNKFSSLMFPATGKLNEVRHTRPTEAARESLNFALNQVKTARRGLQQQTTNTQPANGGIDKTTICHLTELDNAGNKRQKRLSRNEPKCFGGKILTILWLSTPYEFLFSVQNFAHTRYSLCGVERMVIDLEAPRCVKLYHFSDIKSF